MRERELERERERECERECEREGFWIRSRVGALAKPTAFEQGFCLHGGGMGVAVVVRGRVGR